MKIIRLVVLVVLTAACARADGVEALRAGLEAFRTNGPDALARTLYSSRDPVRVAALKERVGRAAAGLGEVIDTEVFAPRSIGRHVQRLYGVIYFAERPLWVRAEYYAIGGRAGMLSIEFSPDADDILPLEIGVASR